ncbi:MAG TPA: small multi-drug export protein [Halanaerobiales bacterium]|nr:small multi-drug export protein [Halanaerobiales bacterium]
MDNAVFEWFNQFLSREMAVFFTACLPIVELRGAIPLAISLGISPGKAYWIAVAGNMFPVIPLLLFLEPIRDILVNKLRIMAVFFNWLDKRTIKKSDKIEKYGALALILFTAVPLPTTGAWTASLAALIFKIKFRYAFPAIVIGIFIAGVVVTFLSVSGKALF